MISGNPPLNIVRIGSDMTFSSLKQIGNELIDAFRGIIQEFQISHHSTPVVESIDAQLLTMVLNEAFGGHTLGITDADLKTDDEDEFYSSIIGGKNPLNDVAVVSTKKLLPKEIHSESEYQLYISRTLKVSIHEVGHNFGLTDHAAYKTAPDGKLCPMTKGEFNKFGYKGYVSAIVDGRGLNFCNECSTFLRSIYRRRRDRSKMMKDGLGSGSPTNRRSRQTLH